MEEKFVLIDVMYIGRVLYAGIKSTIPFAPEGVPGLQEGLNHVYADLVYQVCMHLDFQPTAFVQVVGAFGFPDLGRFSHLEWLQTEDARIKLVNATREFAIALYPKIKKYIDLGNPLVETMPENANLDHVLLRVIIK